MKFNQILCALVMGTMVFASASVAAVRESARDTALFAAARQAVKTYVATLQNGHVHGEPEVHKLEAKKVLVLAEVSAGWCGTPSPMLTQFDGASGQLIPVPQTGIEKPRLLLSAKLAVRRRISWTEGAVIHGELEAEQVAQKKVLVRARVSSGQCGTPVPMAFTYDDATGMVEPARR
jgi:hypothetical protein